MLGNGVGTQTPLGNLCRCSQICGRGRMGMRHHSKRRSGVESPSAFAPFDGILGRITEPLARAASEIEIPAVNAWLNSPAEKVTSVVADFETSGKMAAQHLIGRGFVGSVTWGSFEKRMPAIKFEDSGTP